MAFTLTEPGKIFAADFTDDGQFLAVGSEDTKVYIYYICGASVSGGGGGSSTPTTNNTNCSVYTAGLTGCAVCINNTVCHECVPGYYLGLSSQC